MSLHRPAPTPPLTPPQIPARRARWPYYVLAFLLVAGAVVFFVVRRADSAPPDRVESGLTLAEGVAAGGAVEGTWGKYEMVTRGPKTVVDAEKFQNTRLEVPVLHLDTTEPELAKTLTADGYTCTPDNETCRRTGLGLKFSGPETGITYLVATGKGFETVFGHLDGNAVAPVQDWIAQHLDGRSHTAYVAGWRVDLEVTPAEQTRLTLFNEQHFLTMS